MFGGTVPHRAVLVANARKGGGRRSATADPPDTRRGPSCPTPTVKQARLQPRSLSTDSRPGIARSSRCRLGPHSGVSRSASGSPGTRDGPRERESAGIYWAFLFAVGPLRWLSILGAGPHPFRERRIGAGSMGLHLLSGEQGTRVVVGLDRVLETGAEATGARYAALGVLNARRDGLEQFLTAGLDAGTCRAIGHSPCGRGCSAP